MADLMTAIQYTIQDKIVPRIYQAEWQLDPFFPMLKRSSQNVSMNENMGRAWTVKKTWCAGLAGGAYFTGTGGPDMVSYPGETNGMTHVNLYASTDSFPAYDETTTPSFFQSSVTLIEQRGNFFLPHELLRADQLSTSISSVVSKHLEGVSKLLAQQETALWYSAANGILATVGDASQTGVWANGSDGTSIILDLDAHADVVGRIHRFRSGMMVDFLTNSGSTPTTTSYTKENNNFFIVVDAVDPLNQKVTFRKADNSAWTITTAGLDSGDDLATGTTFDEMAVVLKDSWGSAPHCMESMIAEGSSVTEFYGLAVASYPEFLSYAPSVSGAPTESDLNKHVGVFTEAFPGVKINGAITTQGVLLDFIDNLDGYATGSSNDGRYRFDRTNKAVNYVAGWESFSYRFGSKPIEFYTSTYAKKGTIYMGWFMNGGFTRYVPPKLPKASSSKDIGNEVEFVATLGGTGGYKGIFKIAHNSVGGTTGMVEAPFVRRWNIMPNQPNFMILSGYDEIWD